MVLCDNQSNLPTMALANEPNHHQAQHQAQHQSHHQHPHHHHHHHLHHHHHHHHHHPSHSHHHCSRSTLTDIDHYDTFAMQNNFTIKRVESVARRLKVLENLEHIHEEEARTLVTNEKSHLYNEGLANYQSLEASCATTYTGTEDGGSQISLASGSSKRNLFTFSGTESDKIFASSSLTTSLEAILEESNSPSNRAARNKIVACLLTTGFSLYAVFSIIAPFYPQEAGHKGIPKSIFGLVFSVHALTIMLISPIIGKLLHRFEIKNLLTLGVLLTGCCMILFGFLHYIHDPVLFGLLSFLLRIFGAIGFAVFHTSANIYITKLYPHSIGTVFGLVETFCGFGLSFGPIIGGGLYEWSGFPMPFWIFGSLTLFNIILYYHLIKPLSEVVPEFEEQLSDDPDTPKLTYWKLLMNFRVIVICFATIIISQNQSFLDPTVEPHLYRHGVKESSVAMTFFLMNAAFAMLSPLVGLISLRVNKYTLMSLGLILSATGLLSLGPPWFLPTLRPDLQNSCLSMVAMGIAYSLTFVPSFEALLEHAVEKDKFENLQTYSLVAGLYTAIFSLGEATGPAFGGIFTQYFSFQLSTIIMSCITYFAAFLMIMTRFM